MKANKLIKDLIYPELSYKLMGVLFTVQNKLGSSYQEKYYQRAIVSELQEQKIPFIREKEIILRYGNEGIGKYRLDFVIDNKVALEIKTVPFLKDEFVRQLLAYLVSANLKLGIVANFRTQRLTYKRVVNPKVVIK